MKKFLKVLFLVIGLFALFNNNVLAKQDETFEKFVNEFKTGKGFEGTAKKNLNITSDDNSITISRNKDGNIYTSTLLYNDGELSLKESDELTGELVMLNTDIFSNVISAYCELNNLDSEKVLSWILTNAYYSSIYSMNTVNYETNGVECVYGSISDETESNLYAGVLNFRINLKGKLTLGDDDYSKTTNENNDSETVDNNKNSNINKYIYVVMGVCITIALITLIIINHKKSGAIVK